MSQTPIFTAMVDDFCGDRARKACDEIVDSLCNDGERCECLDGLIASDDGTQCVCGIGMTFIDPTDTSLGCEPGEPILPALETKNVLSYDDHWLIYRRKSQILPIPYYSRAKSCNSKP